MQTQPAPSINRVARELFDPLPRHYDLLVDLLSFGQNRRWRRTMVGRVVPARPRRVLDVATGTAGVALQIVRRSPGSTTVVGVDLTPAMLAMGQDNIDRAEAGDEVVLTAGRAEELPFPDATFDAVTFTYLLRYVDDPAATLRELSRVLRPDGVLASLEFGVPEHPIPRGLWWVYTRLVLPAAGRLWGRAWYRVGRFLGPSISNHYERHPVASIVEAWEAAGLGQVATKRMSLGGGLVMWGRKAHG
jgi:demethylmenaquinone methyltransferase/2-methoxy-6-polyprenyl-1,4-benzoquinol methylase